MSKSTPSIEVDHQPVIHVAVGVIDDGNGNILISKRAADVHQAGLWEFPGGKIESGESVVDALKRELNEELGINVVQSQSLMKLLHDYGDCKVCLHIYQVNDFTGSPHGKENQPVRWCSVSDLNPTDFPAANRPVIQVLKLPSVVQITGAFNSISELLDKCSQAIACGIKLLHFRAHELSDKDYVDAAQRVSDLCRRHGVQLILNRHPAILDEVDADGLHLSRHYLSPVIPGVTSELASRPVTSDKLFSVSCHNLSELERAQELNVDYCFLSPVMDAISHDAGNALGWEQFQSLLVQFNLPVYALGGMTSTMLGLARDHGAIGVAQVSEYWK